jgi:peptidoglycan/xylan/chitin deacetylase (PgdA/CDA1 family)
MSRVSESLPLSYLARGSMVVRGSPMLPQRKLVLVAAVMCAVGCGVDAGGTAAQAAEASCLGNPDALGVSRVITVSPADYSRLGRMQYRQSLPLADHEVVLTFDDGPLPPYTGRILAALAHECVKATFFMVGRMAAAYPRMAQLVAELGHTIGNHSQNHPIHFDVIGEDRAEREVETGMRSIKAALGGDGTLAPFFRIPGLGRTHAVEHFLQAHSMIVWSADTVADDWTPITSDQVLHRALRRLEEKGRGILLLHDIQPRTALMLPTLLRELKKRGFRIVHVVPGKAAPQPTPPAQPGEVMMASAAAKLPWPRLLPNDADSVEAITALAREASLGTHRAPRDSSRDGAKHIKSRKPERPVQSAALDMSRYRPDPMAY